MIGILEPFLGWIAAGVGLIVAIAGAFWRGKSAGRSQERQKARGADYERASEVRRRADDALRRSDGDTRPVDERLRERGRLRD